MQFKAGTQKQACTTESHFLTILKCQIPSDITAQIQKIGPNPPIPFSLKIREKQIPCLCL